MRPSQRLLRQWWVVGVAAAVIAACGPSDGAADLVSGVTTNAPAPEGTVLSASLPEYGGEVRVGVCPVTEPFSVNPLIDPGGVGGLLQPAVGAAVWQLDTATNEIVPGVLTELPTVENGGLVVDEEQGTLTVQYDLDPDAVWADGMPITGGDLAFTYEVFTDPQLRCPDFDDVESYLEEHHGVDASSLEPDSLLADLGIASADVVALVSELTGGFELRPEDAAAVNSAAVLADIVAYETRCVGFNFDRPPPYDLIDPESITWDDRSFSYTLTDLVPEWRMLFHIILPEHDVAGTDVLNGWTDRLWVSGGPFVLEPVDDPAEVVLTRNDRYWKTDPVTGMELPYLDRVVLGPFLDRALAHAPEEARDEVVAFWTCEVWEPSPTLVAVNAAMVGAGDFDMAALTFPPPAANCMEAVEQAAADPSVSLSYTENHRWRMLWFNFDPARQGGNPDSLNEHLEYRQAVAQAIDRERLGADLLAIPARPLDSYISVIDPALPARGWAQYDYDPDAARSLLVALCERLGRDCEADRPRLVITLPEVSPMAAQMADLVTEMLDEVGITVETTTFDGLPIYAPDWDVAFSAWLPLDPGIIDLIYHHTLAVEGEGLSANIPGWGVEGSLVGDEFSESYFELWEQMRRAVDDAALWPLIAEAEKILSDQMIFLPLFQERAPILWSAAVEHLEPAAHQNVLWDVAYWRRTDREE